MNDNMTVSGRERRLNIGAGKTHIPHFINIDIAAHAEVPLDLNRDPLPFAGNSVDVVFSYHTLEHLSNYLFALGEIHRVLRHGGQLLVGVPYVTSTLFNLVNPYHRQHFNEFAFDFFEPRKLLGSAAETGGVMFQKVFHRFHYMPEFAGKSEEEKNFARRHWFNTVKKIDFGLLAVKDEHRMFKPTPEMQSNMMQRFDNLLAARKAYPGMRPD